MFTSESVAFFLPKDLPNKASTQFLERSQGRRLNSSEHKGERYAVSAVALCLVIKEHRICLCFLH